ncbi:MAG: 4-alpha-glucanotransferase [Ignavibacteriaceae bacterium]|jgi:4-alpha-glucanotransferase|nr:4-alpha-glucanotransferase [Ignavibacteriaceae bacterium]
MNIERSAGILLHPTSLPGKFGIGDLGEQAFNFINFLEASGQTLWQVFPLGPTGYGDSPYQCFSAFAGSPLLISPEILAEEGYLKKEDLTKIPKFDPINIDFGGVIDYKNSLLRKAFENFVKEKNPAVEKSFSAFCEKHNDWLDDYSLFMAVKNYHGGNLWTTWNKEIALRKKGAIEKWKEKVADEIQYQKFLQFNFFKQWHKVKKYANHKGIKIIGDLPIFIAYDSADLWANKSLFTVDENGKLLTCAGVPPDYFSPTGQLWGNPLYRWDEMEKDDFLWWRKRISALLELIDIVRIDHFRGFEAYWEIPGDAPTAETGKWVKAPGDKFFTAVRKHLGDVPIIAEDLGVITKEVNALRDKFNFPGIKILQFAFGTKMETKFLPHNFIPNCVVHTGSHDNDTTRGYFEKAKEEKHKNDIYEFTQKYLGYYGDDITNQLIKTAYASVAKIVVIPLQDMLNFGNEARMNFPGTLGGNWSWRFTWEQVPYNLAGKYKKMCEMYQRPPKPEKVESEK